MATSRRFRYTSDDPAPVQLDPSLAATPAEVEPGDVFELGVPDDELDAVAKRVAADPRFVKVKASEPVTTAYSGWTGDELRDEVDAREVDRTGARTNADLESLLVESDRRNPQPIGNLGSSLPLRDELVNAELVDETATAEGGTEPDPDTTPEA